MSRFVGAASCGGLRRYRDVFVGCVLFLIFALIIVGAQQVRMIVIAAIDARFWPTLVGILGCALSAVYVAQSYLAEKRRGAAEKDALTVRPQEPRKFSGQWDWRTISTFALLILYLIGISLLGWILSTVAYLFLQFLVFTEPGDRKLSRIAIVTIVFTAGVYIFFRYVFLLMLPSGSLW